MKAIGVHSRFLFSKFLKIHIHRAASGFEFPSSRVYLAIAKMRTRIKYRLLTPTLLKSRRMVSVLLAVCFGISSLLTCVEACPKATSMSTERSIENPACQTAPMEDGEDDCCQPDGNCQFPCWYCGSYSIAYVSPVKLSDSELQAVSMPEPEAIRQDSVDRILPDPPPKPA
jgi:hypothetical protein